MNQLKSIDLFAGIGGIRLGFDRAFKNDIETVFVCEWDENAQKTYRANFSDEFAIAGDITKIEEKEFVFLKYMYSAERYCANRIALMLKVPPAEIAVHSSRLSQFEEKNGIIYDRLQREAIQNALTKGIMILTGGPGTGKTTTLNAMIQLLEESGAKIALAAPTGRAAKPPI